MQDALGWAVDAGSNRSVTALLEQKADPEVENYDGFRALTGKLELTLTLSLSPLLLFLLSHLLSPLLLLSGYRSSCLSGYRSSCHPCCLSGCALILWALAAAVLSCAQQEPLNDQHVAVVTTLLAHGANPLRRDRQDFTPLAWAKHFQQETQGAA